MATKRPPQSAWVELMLLVSVGFVAVLVLAWIRMPELQRGVRTVAVDVSQRLGVGP